MWRDSRRRQLPNIFHVLVSPSVYRVTEYRVFLFLLCWWQHVCRRVAGEKQRPVSGHIFFVCVIFYRAALGLTEFRGNSCHCNLPSALGATTKPGKKKTRYAPLTRFCLAGAAECVPLRLDAIFWRISVHWKLNYRRHRSAENVARIARVLVPVADRRRLENGRLGQPAERHLLELHQPNVSHSCRYAHLEKKQPTWLCVNRNAC